MGSNGQGPEKFELAASESIDVTPEIDEIGELLRKSGRSRSEDGPDAPWRHGYPYDKKMTRRQYEHRKRALQIELLKLQAWVKENDEKIVIIFEGRDAAGKGGAIKRFTEHLNPRGARVMALEKPTERERTQWYFQRYVAHLPAGGGAVAHDAFHACAVVPGAVHQDDLPTEYLEFTRSAPEFERMLVNSGIHLIKFWFSVGREEQHARFVARSTDPVKQWKLSPTDLASLDKWDAYTEAKENMLFYTDTPFAPWTIVKSNDKKRARLEAMRWVLSQFDYTGKDRRIVGSPDPLIIGPPATVYDEGENPASRFPSLPTPVGASHDGSRAM